jgi:hypothetical protein
VRDINDEGDEMIRRIVDELKTLPPVPADATARVLARVDAARRGEGPSAYGSADDDVIFFPTSTEEMPASRASGSDAIRALAPPDGSRGTGRFGRRFVVSLPAAIGYALAATLAGFLIRGAVPRPPGEPTVARTPNAPVAETLGARTILVPAAASTRALQETPVKVQFVLDAPRASSVTVVGDFNAWDGSKTPLERDSSTGVWSALVDVHPGRHVYAFLVDGKTWTLDPNAPRTKDLDYGTEQSVMIVGMQ